MIELTEEQFKRFQSLIYQHSGIRLDDRKQTLVRSRLQRRLRQIEIDDIDQYYQTVTSDRSGDELQALIDVITTNETSFYRTESHFEWFRDEFLTEVARQAKKGQRPKTLRLWSAACSVGAEPYTMLFCLHDRRGSLRDLDIQLLASDLSTDSLAKARRGRFKDRLITGIDPKQAKRFFKKIDGDVPEYQIRDEFASQVTFFQHNLIHPLRQPPIDCVFLRNVLIYFDDASKQTVLDHITAAIAPGGYLVIGPSEGIYGLRNPLTKLSTFLYQKPV